MNSIKKQRAIIAAITLFSIGFLTSGLALAYPYQDANQPIETRVEDLLARMTTNEKVGQMTQGERGSVTNAEVTTYFLGSVLSGGGSAPADNSPNGWANMYDAYQAAALSTRLGIPIIYGIDAVHGHNNARDAVIFPHNIGLGAANDPELMERVGAVTALEVAATGLDWTFGPCLAVVRDERWGRTYEGFSEDPSVHNNITAAYVRGFQGADINIPGEKIVACAKHYIGDGGTTGGQNAGNTACTEEFLRAVHLPPYQRAIEAGVGTFMTSYSSWNGTRCTGYTWLLTNLLKVELGFDGFVVSDWNSIMWLPGTYKAQIKQAINAGIDMAMAPGRTDWQQFISNLKSLVSTGDVPTSRIDDAVRRILRIKFRAGLFERPYTDRSLASSFGSAEHRAVAREAVRKSLVLLKNQNHILPIAKNADVFVAGRNADSLKRQCGGWTIGWQGMPSESSTSGTTILDGIQSICTGSVTYNLNGSGAAGHDVAIVVVGEDEYAEGYGDDSDLHLYTTDVNTINTVRASGTPYVIVLVSGRPMIITDELEDADAFVAAWLPGTEGDGVAEVLFGDYGFTGRLSYSWPRDMSQIPINIGDAIYDPLFPFGYGLGSPADLNEDGFVNWMDVKVFCDSWLKVPGDAGYDSRANLYDDLLSIVNFYDFAVFADEWN
jgi:beta-glucosidase